MPTFLYSVFHLNLAYSSIAEKDIPKVIERCYWPLLRLAEKFPKAVSIEASGYTIEKIHAIDPAWTKKLQALIRAGKCELLASGYAQIIGPLVPAEVNERNFALGGEVYETILGVKPKIVYVNEQAYGQGMVRHYKKAGYDAMVMEWNNPAHFHPEWDREMSYYPQIVESQSGETLSVVWNNSTHFQRFQRYIHGEADLKHYLSYINAHKQEGRYFCLYGSDAEVFDFRPGRFHAEAAMGKESEWKKISALFKSFAADASFSFVLPSEVLLCKQEHHAFQKLRLESPEEPIPVKKQEKYNITRWALTGKRTMEMNTACHELFLLLKNNPDAPQSWWKELCFFWSSDLRTHTEMQKSKLYEKNLLKRIATLRKKMVSDSLQERTAYKTRVVPFKERGVKVTNDASFVVVDTPQVYVVLNNTRGLAFESVVFKEVSPTPLITTLHQGCYEDIDFNADFFSGHAVLDTPGFNRVTDLSTMKPTFQTFSFGDTYGVVITGIMKFGGGTVTKKIFISNMSEIKIEYLFSAPIPPQCSFRAGFVTFNPEMFDEQTLFYRCHNGGFDQDSFSLTGRPLKITPVSLLVSARRALGNTTGELEVGDKEKTVILKTNMSGYAALPMIQFEKMLRSKSFFLRTKFSLQEFDDTTIHDKVSSQKPIKFELTITARKNA